ncbi:hypothetical protein RQP46_008424 [Phenoliferia psychrophenolica]
MNYFDFSSIQVHQDYTGQPGSADYSDYSTSTPSSHEDPSPPADELFAHSHNPSYEISKLNSYSSTWSDARYHAGTADNNVVGVGPDDILEYLAYREMEEKLQFERANGKAPVDGHQAPMSEMSPYSFPPLH